MKSGIPANLLLSEMMTMMITMMTTMTMIFMMTIIFMMTMITIPRYEIRDTR